LSFESPAATSLDELLQLRGAAQALQRKVRKKSAAPLNGGSVSRRLGRGLDFAEVREYQPGDDVRMIDWKVTARSGKAHTKLFVEERERPVLLLVDFRSTMRFGTRGMYKCVLAARLAALLGWCAVSAHDRVGGFVIADDWHDEVRPQAGRRGLMGLLRAIVQGQMRTPSAGGEQLAKSLSRLRHGVHGGSTVILLSDFHGFDTAARKAIGSVLHTLDMTAVHVSDPLDYALPQPGRYPMISNATEAGRRWMLAIDSNAQRQSYRQQFEDRQAQLKSLFAHDRHRYLEVSTDKPLLDSATSILTHERNRSAA
jgi:uncharacterized protein (DUF58 family)